MTERKQEKVGWGIWSWGGPKNFGFGSGRGLLALLPALIPLWTVGNRRWNDGTRARQE